MTPEAKKAFDGYVDLLRVAFENECEDCPIRIALTRPGESKAVAFALVVVPDEIGEAGRMQLSGIAEALLAKPPSPFAPMPPRFDS